MFRSQFGKIAGQPDTGAAKIIGQNLHIQQTPSTQTGSESLENRFLARESGSLALRTLTPTAITIGALRFRINPFDKMGIFHGLTDTLYFNNISPDSKDQRLIPPLLLSHSLFPFIRYLIISCLPCKKQPAEKQPAAWYTRSIKMKLLPSSCRPSRQ